MRKKMETQERNATSRASFKCVQCFKTFTDLEVCTKIFSIQICFFYISTLAIKPKIMTILDQLSK